jgi:hypothetical protein
LHRTFARVKMTHAMKREIPTQLIAAAVILFAGGALVAAEYFLTRWYPGYEQRVSQKKLELIPYSNASLGIEVQVAAGIYGRVDSFPGGVKIFRSKFWGVGPSLTITSQPNPDKAVEFSPEILAKWQTQGIYQEIPRYHFDHTRINNRDAVLIWEFKGRSMLLTARVISVERLIEASCTPGQEDETLFMQACESSLRTLKLAGPETPPTVTPSLQEIASPLPGAASPR